MIYCNACRMLCAMRCILHVIRSSEELSRFKDRFLFGLGCW